MVGDFGGGCLLIGRLFLCPLFRGPRFFVLPWLESEALRSTFKLFDFSLSSSLALEDWSVPPALPLGLLKIEVIGFLPFASPSCSSLLLLFLSDWSFLILELSQLSFRAEAVFRARISSSVPMFHVLLFWFAVLFFLLSNSLFSPFFSRIDI